MTKSRLFLAFYSKNKSASLVLVLFLLHRHFTSLCSTLLSLFFLDLRGLSVTVLIFLHLKQLLSPPLPPPSALTPPLLFLSRLSLFPLQLHRICLKLLLNTSRGVLKQEQLKVEPVIFLANVCLPLESPLYCACIELLVFVLYFSFSVKISQNRRSIKEPSHHLKKSEV